VATSVAERIKFVPKVTVLINVPVHRPSVDQIVVPVMKFVRMENVHLVHRECHAVGNAVDPIKFVPMVSVPVPVLNNADRIAAVLISSVIPLEIV